MRPYVRLAVELEGVARVWIALSKAAVSSLTVLLSGPCVEPYGTDNVPCWPPDQMNNTNLCRGPLTAMCAGPDARPSAHARYFVRHVAVGLGRRVLSELPDLVSPATCLFCTV